jgi:hypothetical protein
LSAGQGGEALAQQGPAENLIAGSKVTIQYFFVSKPALGRGLGELLDDSAPPRSPTSPMMGGESAVASGGVATLLRGKKEEPRPALNPIVQVAPGGGVKTRDYVHWSLAAADVCLVAAAGVIGWQNPFGQSPIWFLFSAALVLFGAWLGCLAWQGAGGRQAPAPNPNGVIVSDGSIEPRSKGAP